MCQVVFNVQTGGKTVQEKGGGCIGQSEGRYCQIISMFSTPNRRMTSTKWNYGEGLLGGNHMGKIQEKLARGVKTRLGNKGGSPYSPPRKKKKLRRM